MTLTDTLVAPLFPRQSRDRRLSCTAARFDSLIRAVRRASATLFFVEFARVGCAQLDERVTRYFDGNVTTRVSLARLAFFLCSSCAPQRPKNHGVCSTTGLPQTNS